MSALLTLEQDQEALEFVGRDILDLREAMHVFKNEGICGLIDLLSIAPSRIDGFQCCSQA